MMAFPASTRVARRRAMYGVMALLLAATPLAAQAPARALSLAEVIDQARSASHAFDHEAKGPWPDREDLTEQFIFTIETIPGHTYRVSYKNHLAAPIWTQLDPDFVAANSTASMTDILSVPQRFYRVLRVD